MSARLPPPPLEPDEFGSIIWRKLTEHYTDRLQSLRAQNDGALSPEETARLRGRIAEIKNLLTLGNARPQQPAGDE